MNGEPRESQRNHPRPRRPADDPEEGLADDDDDDGEGGRASEEE